MKRKVLTAILSMVLIFGVIGGVTASARWDYISSVSASCSLNDQTGVVTIGASIAGHQSTTTAVAIEIHIQYYDTAKSKWVTADTDYEWFDDFSGMLESKWTVSPGYTYRGRVYFDAYVYWIGEFTMLDTTTVA